jgi:hypothetical protein
MALDGKEAVALRLRRVSAQINLDVDHPHEDASQQNAT